MNNEDQLAWGSHQPALVAAVAASSGSVLEIGMGDFSTPLLHALCGALGRELRSVEEDSEWANKYIRLANHNHHILISDYSVLEDWVKAEWGVVFIDNSPGGEGRLKPFKLFHNRAQFIVVHDYHLENEDAIAPELKRGWLWHVTRTYQPPTLIASRTKGIPESIAAL